MSSRGLLDPGSYRAEELLGDEAILRALIAVELAWTRALGRCGVLDPGLVAEVAAALDGWLPELDPRQVEDAGNPVLPLVVALRERVGAEAQQAVHTGLTSQDVLDTALMLLSRQALAAIGTGLARCGDALAVLAERHAATVMAGRTLTQFAVPVTFGLVAAQWLQAVLDAAGAVGRVRSDLPVQCGGAAGTLSRATDLMPDPVRAATVLADELGLTWPGLPWHTRRTPITRVADALVEVTDALGVIAGNVLLLGRPEIGEVSEGARAGKGSSSTMPHKANPVLAVLINAAALSAPGLASQLHLAAGRNTDQRPSGPWQAEWPSLQRLLRSAVVAVSQAADLLGGVQVHPERMADRVAAAGVELLSERGGSGEPSDYLGQSRAFVELVLSRHRAVR